MRKSVVIVVLLIVAAAAVSSATASTIRKLEIEGPITLATVWRVERTLDDAEEAGDDLVLIRLDTPGGTVVSMETIVKRMLAAEVPVVVWVGPPGAHAASAGFFILIAADVAAMAPGTRTGAAAAVYGVGQESSAEDVGLKKANQDLAAMLRSIAERRGRNVEAAEKAVLAAEAFTEGFALEEGLIDLHAKDIDELVEKLDGMEVRRFADGTPVTLNTADPQYVESKFRLKQKIVEVLAHPYVVYLLLMGGLLGLYVEFTHPGLVFPGVAGAMCLVLFFLSAQVLPINAIAVLLILLGIVMFILEVKVVSYGMLTVGGLVCLVLGSIMLVDGPIPELRVPIEVIIPATVTMAAIVVFVLYKVTKALGAKIDTGYEGLIGKIGRVTVGLDPEGKVFVHGEIWDAVTKAGAPLPRDTDVRIVSVRNMTLLVEPVEPATADERS